MCYEWGGGSLEWITGGPISDLQKPDTLEPMHPPLLRSWTLPADLGTCSCQARPRLAQPIVRTCTLRPSIAQGALTLTTAPDLMFTPRYLNINDGNVVPACICSMHAVTQQVHRHGLPTTQRVGSHRTAVNTPDEHCKLRATHVHVTTSKR